MALILDTNALSAIADGDPDLKVEVDQANNIAIPVIVLGEYRYGIQQSRYRTRYERWLLGLIPHCQILGVDRRTAEQYPNIRTELKQKGSPIPANALWIAALARQYSLPLLSRDQHFDTVRGLTRIHW